MLMLFAHAGEEHVTTAEAVSHSLLETWYVALLLFIVALAGVAGVVYLLSGKSLHVVLRVVLVVLFIAGVGLYQASPTVSIFALSLGFALALFYTIVGLSRPRQKK